MWEAIERNRRLSWLLISAMSVLLIVLGSAIGGSIEPTTGPLLGAAAAVLLWLGLLIAAITGGEQILLSSAGAHEIRKEDAPQLWNVVEEMTIASSLGAMPRVFIIEDNAPNAFAVGRSAEKAAVAVTTGLLKRLNRDELQGVIAHEIGHIRNMDTRFLTMAMVMMGAIVMMADLFLRSIRFSGRHIGGGKKGGGKAQLVFLLAALAFAVLAPILARLLYFACSRRREYLADASSALFTRFPAGLASALDKIGRKASAMATANRTVAPLYIVNPLQSASAWGLFATHPPTNERIAILRAMGGGADYLQYDEAYRRVRRSGKGCIGNRTLGESAPVAMRAASVEPEEITPPAATEVAQEVNNLLDRLANFLLIPCDCGVRIKVPPDMHRETVSCPRCGASHAIPQAALLAADHLQALPSLTARDEPMLYRRKSTGWESFRCECGQTMQISPAFAGDHLDCSGCKRRIVISGK